MRVFGKNTCLEILKTKQKINKIYLQKSLDENFKNEVLSFGLKVNYCEKDFLNKLTNFKNHQGIVLEIEDFKYCELAFTRITGLTQAFLSVVTLALTLPL